MKVKLKVLVGKSAGKEIPIPAPRFLIGRSSDCHLRPKSDSISRTHCTILTRKDRIVIRDLNSRNGTFVNGERVTEDAPIKDGDQLQIGKLEFQVIVKEPQEGQAPNKEKRSRKKPREPKSEEEGSNAKPDTNAQGTESMEFDVSEWLQEADVKDPKKADPETRLFQLDDTDQMPVADDVEEDEEDSEGSAAKKEKRKPGKLPPRSAVQTNSSREAAADMLKRFFTSR